MNVENVSLTSDQCKRGGSRSHRNGRTLEKLLPEIQLLRLNSGSLLRLLYDAHTGQS